MADLFASMTAETGSILALRMSRSATHSSADSDENLAERVRATGDTAAFALLVNRYRSRIVALARRLLPAEPGEAEDIAQEAFVAAYHKRAGFRRGEMYRPWLYRIAVNRCLDRLRSRQRHPHPVNIDGLAEQEGIGVDPLDNLLANERDYRLQKAVADLPAQYRAVLLLRHFDDLTYEEIAQAVGMPLGTVKTHLFRARALLKQALAGYIQEP